MPLDALQPKAIVQTLALHRQMSPPETLVVKGGTTWARKLRLPRVHFATWDKRLYFPFERRRAEDFFALKNPTASAGFEPANLGTKGQHATSRPPKPLYKIVAKYVSHH